MILENFAVFEGLDGSGTSTQLERLKQHFINEGVLNARTSWEPTDSPVGALIRSALKLEIKMTQQTLAYLFASDRAEHLYQPPVSFGIVRRAT
jgi:dTMP kinase